jgi:hypothetical protein
LISHISFSFYNLRSNIYDGYITPSISLDDSLELLLSDDTVSDDILDSLLSELSELVVSDDTVSDDSLDTDNNNDDSDEVLEVVSLDSDDSVSLDSEL